MSPRIMNVAVPWCQHSPMFGHCASSQTVCRLSARIRPLRRWYPGEPGARTLSHSGFGGLGACGASGMMRATIVLLYRRVALFHHVDVRVMWADTDPAGIVWFGVFFRYFENAEE